MHTSIRPHLGIRGLLALLLTLALLPLLAPAPARAAGLRRIGFADLERLFAYLRRLMEDTPDERGTSATMEC